MPEAQKDLLIQWFDEVWNKKRREAIDDDVDWAALYGVGR